MKRFRVAYQYPDDPKRYSLSQDFYTEKKARKKAEKYKNKTGRDAYIQ